MIQNRLALIENEHEKKNNVQLDSGGVFKQIETIRKKERKKEEIKVTTNQHKRKMQKRIFSHKKKIKPHDYNSFYRQID